MRTSYSHFSSFMWVSSSHHDDDENVANSLMCFTGNITVASALAAMLCFAKYVSLENLFLLLIL